MRTVVAVAGFVAVLGLFAGVNSAQAQYQEPGCDLDGKGHFLVNSGVVYVKGAYEATDPAKRQRMARDARRTLLEAIERRGQEDNEAAWYFLGRYYVLVNDPIGADSAFDRAELLEPGCQEDIEFYRRNMWVPLINQALDSIEAGSPSGAKAVLQLANTIYQGDIISIYYLGSVFGNEGELDSALYYFKLVAATGTDDPERQESFVTAVYNTALIHGMKQEWDSASVWWQEYRKLQPDDAAALASLAQTFEQLGEEGRALAIYDTIMANAQSMDYLTLFQTGERLFVAERFGLAARAFEFGLEKNPYYRPALYNLANAYLAVAETDGILDEDRMAAAEAMEDAAQRLVAVDPQSQESQRLLAAAYQLQRKQNETLAVLQQMEVMQFEVLMDMLQPQENGLALQGRISNSRAEATPIPTVTFEFVDASGNVIATETLEGRTLEGHEAVPFNLWGSGEGVVAVRYTVAG
jgi:tetratricopeptide (TPR) repeat protein